jgi:hypothetical protein
MRPLHAVLLGPTQGTATRHATCNMQLATYSVAAPEPPEKNISRTMLRRWRQLAQVRFERKTPNARMRATSTWPNIKVARVSTCTTVQTDVHGVGTDLSPRLTKRFDLQHHSRPSAEWADGKVSS